MTAGLTVGSLCTGYGGLDMAVENMLGARMLWCSEIEKHPSTLLAQRFPETPNYGDITTIDWNAIPSVDILTGGYPCQPFSHTGLRQGENDERHLWPFVLEAIRLVRPKVTILENVQGHRSLGFDTVLRDCARNRFDVRWVSLRAADAGAPHGRKRLFFAITDPNGQGLQGNQFQSRRHEPTHQRRSEKTVTLLERNDSIPWAEYEPAIRQWERIMGRAAPNPTEPNSLGRPRLTARFHEWMLGLPNGWVTDIAIPYGAMIKLTGNGVLVQQAELAIKDLIP